MHSNEGFWLLFPGPCSGPAEPIRRGAKQRVCIGILAGLLIFALQTVLAIAQTPPISDPTEGFGRVFGLGGHACKQYDDSGKLYIYTEGIPSIGVMSWLQRSDGGTRPNIPMPDELETALPLIPGCLPGKHHAATRTG
nr:hypothetical protein [uncultured Rhodopila sp.]